jgi:photosystem II stability/assembly factor-like uncharacterized protein
MVYANNYGGGVFRSGDGAKTWKVWSKGYSGADIHKMHLPDDNPAFVYALGRSGPFVSFDFGDSWAGIGNGDANFAEWYMVASQPGNSNVVIVSDEHQGVILRSTDGGDHFTEVFRHPDTDASNPATRQGFKALAFAPSSPNVVYAGLAMSRGTILTSPTVGTGVCKSTDGGSTFTAIPSIIDGSSVTKLIVHPADPAIVYASTTTGIFKSTDGAATWTHFDGLGNKVIEALAINPLTPVFIIAGEPFTDGSGGIYTSADDGTNWSGPITAGFNNPNPFITAVVQDPMDQNTYFAGDLYSGIYQSTDQGTTWAPFPDAAMTGLGFRAVKDITVNEREIYAATQGGGIYRFDRITPRQTSSYTLSVARNGAGSGKLSGFPEGISCGVECDHIYAAGALITLTPKTATASTFAGWSGCDRTEADVCVLRMNADRTVTATFVPTITVTSPNGNETWLQGDTKTISWTYAGDPGPSVKIRLFKSGLPVITVNAAAPIGSNGNGSFDWTVPYILTPGVDYRIVVSSTADGTDKDSSNGNFTIARPAITIVAPNGGESWQAGTDKTITWTYTGNPGTTVKLQLFQNGILKSTISSGTATGSNGSGSFLWSLLPTQKAGTGYRIKIISTTSSAIRDLSNAKFTITK